MTTDRPGRADQLWLQRWTWDRRVAPRWLLVGHTGTPQYADDGVVALCADIDGLFVDLPPRPRERVTLLGCEPAESPVPHVILVGCRPEPPLLAAITALQQSTGAGLRRRRVSAEVGGVAADGSVVPLVDGIVSGTIAASVPSALGGDLLDVTIASDAREPHPAGTRSILDLWFTGRPTERNLWARYDRTLRHEWAGVALAHHRFDVPDRPAGTVHLDGRFVTDVEGFYCAIGEAINGPGGYFGWNLDALHDCLCGGWGAPAPLRLVWHDSAVAHEHLVAGYDRHRDAPAVTLDYLLQMLAEHDVKVELR